MGRVVKEPDVRRQELLDIGLSIYFKEGSKGISVKRIVSAANVATGLFYYYFKSKEEFIDEVLDHYITQNIHALQDILKEGSVSSTEKIDAALEAFWAYAEEVLPLKGDPNFQTGNHYILTNKLLNDIKPIVQETIAEGMEQGDFRVCDPSLAAGFIAYGLSSIFDNPLEYSEQTKQEMRSMIMGILHGSNQ